MTRKQQLNKNTKQRKMKSKKTLNPKKTSHGLAFLRNFKNKKNPISKKCPINRRNCKEKDKKK
jgi:hypothetical protein